MSNRVYYWDYKGVPVAPPKGPPYYAEDMKNLISLSELVGLPGMDKLNPDLLTVKSSPKGKFNKRWPK